MSGRMVQTGRSSNWPDIRTVGSARIRDAGIAGAGGAGFPSYAKWEQVDSVDYLLMNHQESEPNYFIDKWLGETHAEEFATLFDTLLDQVFEVIVVSAKWKDRGKYMAELEAETGGTVVPPEDLPTDPEAESGVVFAYTENEYQYGMESVLLNVVADTVIGNDLPMDHGWLVQNTETLYNIYRALTEEKPVTRKFVHVGGNVPRHRFLDVPLGTPASVLLEAAGVPPGGFPTDAVLVHGGPGWCFRIEESADTFGVSKRTNCIMIVDEEIVEENTLGGGHIDVRKSYDWEQRIMETKPTATVDPEYVRIPLITNPEFEGPVEPSEPVASVGDDVEAEEVVAVPSSEGISIPQHASAGGEVTTISESSIEIKANTHTGNSSTA